MAKRPTEYTQLRITKPTHGKLTRLCRDHGWTMIVGIDRIIDDFTKRASVQERKP